MIVVSVLAHGVLDAVHRPVDSNIDQSMTAICESAGEPPKFKGAKDDSRGCEREKVRLLHVVLNISREGE